MWVSLYTHSGQQEEAMISTSLDPFCLVLCLFLWSLQWFRYMDYPALVACVFKTPFAICRWKWKYLLHLVLWVDIHISGCRFCFLWVNCLWWSTGAWHQSYSAGTLFMTQTTWSNAIPMMSTSGLPSPCIWISSTSFYLC